MADRVPSTGAWQSDQELQRLQQAYDAARARDMQAGNIRGAGMLEAQAMARYIDANRQRLGIPNNYTPDPRSGYQTLYDPNQNQIRNAVLTGAGMAAGGYGAGLALGGGPAAAGGAGTGAGMTTTTSAIAPGASVGVGATGAGAGAGGGVGAGASIAEVAAGVNPTVDRLQGAGGGGIGGFFQDNWRDLAGIAGSGAGAYADTQASNRGNKYAGQLDLAALELLRDRDYWDEQQQAEEMRSKLNIDRETEGRVGRGDAWKRLGQAQRVLNPVQRQGGPYAAGPRPVSAAERQGADALTQEVMARLTGGNPIPVPNVPTPDRTEFDIDRDLLDAGGSERFLNYLAPLSGLRRPAPTTTTTTR